MNKFAAFAAVGALAVSALIAGQAAAEDNENSAFAQMVAANTYGASASASQSGTVGYGYHAGFIAKAAHQSNVSVRNVGELPQAEKASFLDRAKADAGAVQALRAEIAQNGDVVRGLQERNVKLDNVIGSIKAADGSTTYIVR